jgi:hypothetical protein
MVENNANMVRLGELKDAFLALPATLQDVVVKLDNRRPPCCRLGLLVVGML